MLKIRSEQLKAFEPNVWLAFENEMVAHSKAYAPVLTGVLTEQQLGSALRQAINSAQHYGFTNRGPIRLYIETMFLCGSYFDSDPLYTNISAVLRSTGDQMERAQRIHESINWYIENVSGPNNINVRTALEQIVVFAENPLNFRENTFEQHMLDEMHRAFPKRASFVGDRALQALIESAREKARHFDLPALRSDALLVILSYAFGHGCTNDPLYPWISQTLADPRIKGPAECARRLEKKAMTWLEHVLARPTSEVEI